MKRLKLLLVALALSSSTIIYAEKPERIYDLDALSAEIELMIRNANQFIPEGEVITVFFSVSEDNTIQYVAVASEDIKTSALLEEKLQAQKLDGEKWRKGMIYELTIEGHRSSADCVANY